MSNERRSNTDVTRCDVNRSSETKLVDVFPEAEWPLINSLRGEEFDTFSFGHLDDEPNDEPHLNAIPAEEDRLDFHQAEFECLKMSVEQLYSEQQIADKIADLGQRVSAAYRGCNRPLVVLGVLKGCSPFLSDLIRVIDQALPIEVDFVDIRSVEETAGHQRIQLLNSVNVRLKNVLLVDDVIDTGKTLDAVIHNVYELRPYSIKACVLFKKMSRTVQYIPEIKYLGFEVPDAELVGYGLDHAQYFRNLPYVGILKGDCEG